LSLRTCGVRSDAGTGTGALALHALQSPADADVTEINHAYLVKPKAELDRPLHCALSPTCIFQMRARRFSKLKIGDAKRQLFTNRGNWHR